MSMIAAQSAYASNDDDVQDMSDPLAVYTQVGAGYTDKGINLKIGQAYDTGDALTAGMNVIELKGIGGEALGWRDTANDSVDSFRYRNFSVDLTNGRAKQLDVSYDFNNESGSASYSVIQTVPRLGPLSLYPLAGAGLAFENGVSEEGGVKTKTGYHTQGTFALVGTYSKIEVTPNIWINYNPMWMTALSGSDEYTANGFAGHGDIFTHEFAISYEINSRMNVRYFANWDEHRSFEDGDHRVEFNYQL
ncbi:hypothetical protein RCJ22_12900 [Vibrio sp. FNV 38]|nr:hypothetical protein [Vibrio sp. FNV 38]